MQKKKIALHSITFALLNDSINVLIIPDFWIQFRSIGFNWKNKNVQKCGKKFKYPSWAASCFIKLGCLAVVAIDLEFASFFFGLRKRLNDDRTFTTYCPWWSASRAHQYTATTTTRKDFFFRANILSKRIVCAKRRTKECWNDATTRQ